MKFKNKGISLFALSLAGALSFASLEGVYAVDKTLDDAFGLAGKDDFFKKEEKFLDSKSYPMKKEDKEDKKPERRDAEKKVKIERSSFEGLTFKVVRKEKDMIRIEGTITKDRKPITIEISPTERTISTNSSTVTAAIVQGVPTVGLSTVELDITFFPGEVDRDPKLFNRLRTQLKLVPQLQGIWIGAVSGKDIEPALGQISSLRPDTFAAENEPFNFTLINVPVRTLGRVQETVVSRGFRKSVQVQDNYYEAIRPMLNEFMPEMKPEEGTEDKNASKDKWESFKNPDEEPLQAYHFMISDKDKMIMMRAKDFKERWNIDLFKKSKPDITLILKADADLAETLKNEYNLPELISVDKNRVLLPDGLIEEVEKIMNDPRVSNSDAIVLFGYPDQESYDYARSVVGETMRVSGS